jgi:hypothetical protein
MSNRGKEYRTFARDCLALAKTIAAPETRDALIEMARIWTRFAEEQEAASVAIPSSEPSQVLQQQEQVQPEKKDKE